MSYANFLNILIRIDEGIRTQGLPNTKRML